MSDAERRDTDFFVRERPTVGSDRVVHRFGAVRPERVVKLIDERDGVAILVARLLDSNVEVAHRASDANPWIFVGDGGIDVQIRSRVDGVGVLDEGASDSCRLCEILALEPTMPAANRVVRRNRDSRNSEEDGFLRGPDGSRPVEFVRAEIRPGVAPRDDDVRFRIEGADADRNAVTGRPVNHEAAFVVVHFDGVGVRPTDAALVVRRRDDGDVGDGREFVVQRFDTRRIDAVVVRQENVHALPTTHWGKERQLVARFESGVQAVVAEDVRPVSEDVDMVAEVAIVVQNAAFEFRPWGEKGVQRVADAVAGFGVHGHLLVASEFG